jgi:hypothetical protein
MLPMIFDDTPPAFDDILATIEKFQDTINKQDVDLPRTWN